RHIPASGRAGLSTGSHLERLPLVKIRRADRWAELVARPGWRGVDLPRRRSESGAMGDLPEAGAQGESRGVGRTAVYWVHRSGAARSTRRADSTLHHCAQGRLEFSFTARGMDGRANL